MLLAIESSCDESAIALYDIEAFLSSRSTLLESLLDHSISSQIILHQEYGGVVPELASREHVRNFPHLLEQLFKKNRINQSDITCIAATVGPGLKGCLLVGLSLAKGIATSLSVPFFPVNHLEGHVLSALLSAPEISKDSALKDYKENENIEDQIFPSLILLVSGGHTQLIHSECPGRYEIIAQTMDDAAGEAFDKIGTLLGLKYPAGASLSKLAENGRRGVFKLPIAVPKDSSHFSFSGLKTAASRLIEKELTDIEDDLRDQVRADIAYEVQSSIVKALTDKIDKHLQSLSTALKPMPKSIIVSGGVAANVMLRNEIRSLSNIYSINVLIPAQEFCTDNAAMIGAAACVHIKRMGGLDKINYYLPDALAHPAVPRFPLDSVSMTHGMGR